MIQHMLVFSIITYNLSQGKEVRVEAVVRGSATLPCPIQPDGKNDSLLLVLWYKVEDNMGGNIPIYSYDARMKNGIVTKWSSDKAFGSRAYFMTSIEPAGLLIANIAPKDSGVYVCRTDFRSSPTKHYRIILDILIPPGSPKIYDGGGKEIQGVAGPYQEGSIVDFSCTSDEGQPTPVISWYYNNIRIYSSDKNGRPGNKIKIRLLKQDFGASLSCEAKNSNITQVARKSFTIDILLPPASTKILTSRKPLSAGKEYEFVCQSSGSNPPATISWWKGESQLDNAIVKEENGQTVSRMKFVPSWEDDGKNIECRASNMSMEDETLEDILELSVYYCPILNIVIQQDGFKLVEGSEVRIECQVQANPPLTAVSWLKDDEVVRPHWEHIQMDEFALTFKNITRSDTGQYVCVGRNQEGESTSSPYNLQVMYEPYCAFGTPKIVKIENPSPLLINSEVYAHPEPMSFMWIRNSTSKKQEKSQQFGNTSKIVVNPLEFGYTETFLSLATNEIGKQKVPCVFHVFYEGPPQRPENCTLAQPHSVIYVLTCLPPVRLQPDYYLLQVQDLETSYITLNITSSIPKFTLIAKESNRISTDLQLDTVVRLGNKKAVSRLFGVNQFGLSGSIDIFINEEGVAHLKQEKLGQEVITHALIIGCICLCAAVAGGIIVLIVLKRLFRSKKNTRPAVSEVVDKDKGKEVQNYVLTNETDL
ncbi:B-cell receptor CD22-like isoform X2 [Artemia franciscana]|uniref:B-cell receptor CD22-like isoform X2 n=1 Tax=Artemia franciscana TaxID=6661 RepID=UPI0032DB2083